MRRVLIAARIAASVLALAVVLWRVDAGAATERIAGAAPGWLLLALAVSIAAVVTSTLLWRLLTVPPRPPFRRMLGMYFGGLFYNNIGLGTIVGDASRVDASVSDGMPVERAAVAVAAERIVSFTALLALSCAGAVALAGGHPALAAAVWAVSAACVAAGAVLWIVVARARLSLLPAAQRGIERFREALIPLGRPRELLCAASLALLLQACTIASTVIVLRALGYRLSPADALLTVPLIALCVLLPFSIQGIGVREATYVYMLGTAGVPAETALSAAVLSYVLTLAVSLIGGLAVLQRAAVASGMRRGRRPVDVQPSADRPVRRAA